MQYSHIVRRVLEAEQKGDGIRLFWREVFWLAEVLRHAEAESHAEALDEERKPDQGAE